SRRFAKSTLRQIIRTAAKLVSFALSFVPCSSRRTPDHRARLEQRLRLRQAWIRRIFRDGPTQLFSMTDLWARLANGRTHANDSESWFPTASDAHRRYLCNPEWARKARAHRISPIEQQ